MPTIVTALTGWLKGLPTFASLSSAQRPPYVRVLAAALSLVIVLAGEWMTGSFDASATTVALQTLFLTAGTWIGALGIFHGIFAKATPTA